MSQHPLVQCFRQRRCFFLPYSAAILVTHRARLALNFVQAANRVQCLFGQLAFIRRVQIEKLSADTLPRQAKHQGLKLFGVYFHLATFTAYFAYMFMWELMFFNYEANVVNACSSADMAHVATYQYAASYFGIISVTLAGGLLTQYRGLLQTALILSALYLCYMLREAYSSNSQRSSLVRD